MASKTNWGRWGKDDELGALNLITPEMICKAAALVRKGRVYPLGLPLQRDTPLMLNRHPPLHTVTYNSNPHAVGLGEDHIVINTHVGTHIDALAHLWVQGKSYGGISYENVTSQGAAKAGIDRVRGIVGRGVMLDMARHSGSDYLPAGHVIQPDELEACAASQKVQVQAGDIVLIRTGWYTLWNSDRQKYQSGKPGLGCKGIEWLIDRDVVAVGADTLAPEATPSSPDEGSLGRAVAHIRFLRDAGGYLLELLDLEELGKDNVHEFLFVAAPLRITGGLGSPMNPLAIA